MTPAPMVPGSHPKIRSPTAWSKAAAPITPDGCMVETRLACRRVVFSPGIHALTRTGMVSWTFGALPAFGHAPFPLPVQCSVHSLPYGHLSGK